MTSSTPARKVSRLKVIRNMTIGVVLGLTLTDAMLYLVLGFRGSFIPVLSIQVALTAYMGAAILVPQWAMNRFQPRLTFLTEGKQLDRKSAYIRLMYAAGTTAVVLTIVTFLIANTLVPDHRFMLAFAGVTLWLGIAAGSVLGWAYARCPF